MTFINLIKSDLQDQKQKSPNTKINEGSGNSKTNSEYFDTFDPETGLRFDIPMVSPNDPDYFYTYIYYMKLRDRAPETFERILNWE